MANNVTNDHEQAFDEAYKLAGILVTIGNTGNVKAIRPQSFGEEIELDSSGMTRADGETEITVKTADLPSVTRTTVVSMDSVDYRIASIAREGAVCQRLTLITP